MVHFEASHCFVSLYIFLATNVCRTGGKLETHACIDNLHFFDAKSTGLYSVTNFLVFYFDVRK